MSNINDFKPWATDPDADVLTQAAFIALIASLGNKGFVGGTAISGQLNKVWRQSSFTAAFLNQYVSDTLAVDVLDDGDEAAAEARFIKALFTSAGIEQSIAGATNTTAATNRRAYVATAALVLTVAQTTTLDTTWRNSVYAFGGDVMITPNAADSINSLGAGVSFLLRRGSLANIVTDGAGKLYIASAPVPNAVTTVSGTATLTSANAGLVLLDTTTGPFTVTLPVGAGLFDLGFRFVKISQDINAATIRCAGADTIGAVGVDPTLVPVTSLTLDLQFSALQLECSGAAVAEIPGGSVWFQPDSTSRGTNSLDLITGQANLVLAGKSQIYMGANVTFDGTHFNRQNIAAKACAIEIDLNGNIKLLTVAAGANPIAWITGNVWTDGSVLSGTVVDDWTSILPRELVYEYHPNGHGFISVFWVGQQSGWTPGQAFTFPMPAFPANPYSTANLHNSIFQVSALAVGIQVVENGSDYSSNGHVSVKIAAGSSTQPAPAAFNLVATCIF